MWLLSKLAMLLYAKFFALNIDEEDEDE